MEFLRHIAAGIVSLLLPFTGISVPQQNQPANTYADEIQALQNQISDLQEITKLGATIPKITAGIETSLAASISKTATSMTLVKGTDKVGTSLSGYIGFTIDEGGSNVEYVAGTASGTAITALLRGLDPVTGNTTSSALAYSHGKGATVKITDFPSLGVMARIMNGDEVFPNIVKYNSSTITNSLLQQDVGNVASVAYVNSVASSGVADASLVTAGKVEQATCAELASSTPTGGTTAPLFAPSTCFSATSSSSGIVPVVGSNNKLSTNFIDQTANYTWSGNNTSTGTSIFTGSVSFTNTVSFDSIPSGFWGRQIFTTSSTWTIPTGVTRIFITGIGPGGGGAGSNGSSGYGGGGSGSWVIRIPTSTTPGTTLSIIIGNKGLGSLSSTSTPSSGSPTSVGSWLILNGGQMASTTSGGVATTTILNGIALTGNSSAGSNGSINTGGVGANITSGAWICLGGTAGNSGGGPGGNSVDGYGCGGGGGGGNAGIIGRGGDGGPSVVIIEY